VNLICSSSAWQSNFDFLLPFQNMRNYSRFVTYLIRNFMTIQQYNCYLSWTSIVPHFFLI
jgi:hypothetical protein